MHECEGKVCIAIYERETGFCIGGCDENYLSVGVLSALVVAGWDSQTTGQVKGVRGKYFASLASQIRVWAEGSSPNLKGSVNSEVVLLAMSIQAVSRQIEESRFDVSWERSSLETLLRRIAGILGGDTSRAR